MQRYMAAAACLLLVCLFGWLYWPSTGAMEQGRTQLATNQGVGSNEKKPVQKEIDRQRKDQIPGVSNEKDVAPESTTNQVAIIDHTEKSDDTDNPKESRTSVRQNPARSSQSVPVAPRLAQEKPVENKPKAEPASPTYVAPITQVPAEQVADAKPVIKPSPIAERVLVVTIAEPEALVAARQIAKASVEEKAAAAQDEKLAKETKAGGLWQQVKRIKQGEVFARQDNTGNEESGLLGRAYSGLKHSLEKDKTTKQ
ncbi:hypothetical protein GCM10028818_27320 [Spirosoma horti]